MKSNAKSIALGGMMAALALVILLLGGLIGVGIYVAPIVAGILLAVAADRLPAVFRVMLFLVVAILSFLLVPDLEESLLFAAFFGWYPLVADRFSPLRPWLRWMLKLILFNACLIGAEALLMLVLIPATEPWWFLLVLLVLFNVVFLLYDHILPRAKLLLSRLMAKIGF